MRDDSVIPLLVCYTLVTMALAAGILRYYTSKNWKKVHIGLHALLFFAFFVCFFPVALLPVDVTNAIYTFNAGGTGGSGLLISLWYVIFVCTQLLSWVILPVAQSFCEVGQFTPGKKLLQAIKENVKLYIAMGVVLGILGAWVFLKEGKSISQISQVVISASNAFGLLTTILLMGYGMVELPRTLFFSANLDTLMSYMQAKAPNLTVEKDIANVDWMDAMATVKSLDIAEGHTLREPYEILKELVETFEEELQVRNKETNAPRGRSYSAPAGSPRGKASAIEEVDLAALVKLHREVRQTIQVVERTTFVWERHQKLYYFLEDVKKVKELNSTPQDSAQGDEEEGGALGTKQPTQEVSGMYIPHSLREHQHTPEEMKSFKNKFSYSLEYLYWVKARSVLLRIMACMLCLLSFAVWWSEIVTPKNDKIQLSIVSLLRSHTPAGALQQVSIVVFILYIAICSYWSLFQLKLFDLYSLVPHHSTPSSLCFSAYMLSRLIMPMCFNYLCIANFVISGKDPQHEGDAISFVKAFGTMKTDTLLGPWFSVWFMAILLFVMTFLTLINAYSHLLRICSLNTFSQNMQSAASEHSHEGIQILDAARTQMELEMGRATAKKSTRARGGRSVPMREMGSAT